MIGQNADFAIVGEAEPERMVEAVAAMMPDVVLLVDAGEEGVSAIETLRVSSPSLRIITIDREGRCATAWQADAPPRFASEVSAATLLEMMRGSAR